MKQSIKSVAKYSERITGNSKTNICVSSAQSGMFIAQSHYNYNQGIGMA